MHGMCGSRPPLAIHRLALVAWLASLCFYFVDGLPWLHCLVCLVLSLFIVLPNLLLSWCMHCLAVPYHALPRMVPWLVGVRVGFSVRITITVRNYLFFLFGWHAIILLRFDNDCLYRLVIVTHHNVDRSR
jgi:hypothetical protein